MRKWCPELFTSTGNEGPPAGIPRASFESAAPSTVASGKVPDTTISKFEKDFSLTNSHSLWDLMNRAERDQILVKAREVISAEFETREEEILARHQAELAEVQTAGAERVENWSVEFSAGLTLERQEFATKAAGLALVLARKIIRDTVHEDPDFLARTIETALFKVGDANPLTVILHPDDAELLGNNTQLMTRLRIGHVVPDRRVERGGCRIRAGVREWDATLSSQMDVLTEIIEEVMAHTGGMTPPGSGGNNDPGLA